MALADWIETSLVLLADEPYRISDAEITGALADANLDADLAREDLTREIRRRQMILGDAYPYVRDGEGFSRISEPQDRLPYVFMLLTSLNQYYGDLVFNAGTANRPARLFEQLTALALQKYVNGRVVRLGASRVAPVPSTLPAAVRYLADEMGEQETYGQVEEHDAGDDGCDLVLWRSFPDQRPGQLILLTQCAIGTDWKNKRSELDIDLWSQHVNWHSRPAKAFAVPFVHAFGPTWRETCTRGGVLFDRPRVGALVDSQTLPDPLANELRDWVMQRMEQVAGLSMD